MALFERLLTTNELAVILGVSAGTIHVWRCTKRVVIPYLRINRSIRYRMTDVQEFLRSREVAAS